MNEKQGLFHRKQPLFYRNALLVRPTFCPKENHLRRNRHSNLFRGLGFDWKTDWSVDACNVCF